MKLIIFLHIILNKALIKINQLIKLNLIQNNIQIINNKYKILKTYIKHKILIKIKNS